MKKLVEDENLRLLGLRAGGELVNKIDEKLVKKFNLDPKKYTFLLNVEENWFSDGCEKIVIKDSVRDMSTVICTDPYNFSLVYNMRGFKQHVSPNDLMQQLRDAVGACNAHSSNLSILMPMLYVGRQHRRNGREALSCANWLREFDDIRSIKRIITCDAHDQGVEQAMQNTEFDNLFLTNVMLEKFINDVSLDELRDIVFVAPDNGAIKRTNVYLNSFDNKNINRTLGHFYKERDYNVVVDGKNPIRDHKFICSDDIAGKTAIVVDDMISSGSSMFDVIDKLNSLGVYNIYIFVTFSLFTVGISKFNEYYNDGKFRGVYTTNATYIDKKFLKEKWLHVADCSVFLTDVIYNIYRGESITSIINNKAWPIKLIEDKFNASN